MSMQTDLATFSEGTGFLLRRPLVTLGLALMGMVLAALVPVLQIRFALPNDEMTAGALSFASLFPLQMYFVPRFLAEADASGGDRPLNLPGEWEKLFDARWMKAMGAKFLLGAAVGIGALAFILPGLVILLAFCWMPTRVLLRGESLADAARNSLQLMIRSWRRVLVVCMGILVVYLAAAMILSYISGFLDTRPAPWEQLTHPRVWIANFASVLLSVWVSGCLLALFRRIENAPAPSREEGPNSN